MPYAHHPLRKRQSNVDTVVPSASGVTGGTTALSVGLGSSLLLGPTASPVPSVTNPLNPTDPVITVTESSSPLPSSTSSSSAALHTSHPMPMGAVLGISAGVFVVAVAAMFAVYTRYKRRTYARATRRPPPRGSSTSRVEGGNRGGGGDKWERLEGDKPPTGEVNPPAPPKTPEIGKFELFEKDPSVRSVSDEKANHTFDPAAMPNFVKYHPDLAEDLSTVPPSRPFATGAAAPSQVVSWGGETAADSFLTLRTSGSMSPSAAIRQTPMTTDSALHRWESAEVLIMDEPVVERPSVYPEVTRNPFGDDASRDVDGNEADTRASSGNPFFNASQDQHNPFSDRSSQSRSRKSSISTVKRSRSNSVASRGTVRAGAGDNALLSLIAALDSRPAASEDQSTRVSIQTASSVYTQASMVPPTPKAF